MTDETQTYDVVVVGGGLAAICAAIQASRLGCSVVLLEKDPVLGGNGGPLLGVHPSGAHSFHPYASELGIVGELIEEAAWQRAKIRTHGQHYNISQQYETVLKQKLDEAGVTVYRRTYGRDAETETLPDGRQRITAVIAEDTARFRTVRFEATVGVIDGSGDGHVAMKAGAGFRKGREAKSETGERSALDVADDLTLGTSLTALCRKCSAPVEFIPPPGTPPFEAGYGRAIVQGPSGKPIFRYSSWNANDEFCFLWITETGGQLDTLDADHLIYEELLQQVYSAWASLKAEEPAAANWELTWISPKAGKRESRRFLGDVVVSQTDVEHDTPWPDAVCFGGYSVDIHNPSGVDQKQVTIVFYSIPPLWSMPYRALYSKDVANLWLAGRLASVTHLGLGSWRLQRTMAGGGQAVGVAAALAKKHGCDNRGIFSDHLTELQQTILRHDGAIVRVPQSGNASEFLVTQVEDGLVRKVATRQIVRNAPTPWRPSIPKGVSTPQAMFGQPHALFLDLPMAAGESGPQAQFRIAIWQKPWRSQALFVSPEETGFSFRTSIGKAATLGRLVAALQPGFTGRIDRSVSILIELFATQVASVSFSQLLNGANAAAIRSACGAWEVVQFAAAEEISPEIWRLSGLLRGQAGTDDAMAAGASIGADFVMLDDAVRPAGLLESEKGLLLNWRVGPSGTDLSDVHFVTRAEIGGVRALLPLSPAHLRASRIGGDLKLSWIRRGRIDADKWEGSDIPLGEEREEYRVEIAPAGGVTVRTAIVTEPSWLYAAAAMNTDFGALPAEIDVTVRQFSVAAGWGIPVGRRIDLF